ncbi:MAG: hypothetical protein HYR96_02210 [Deltaproteobacteria bacterium]|nr:hypothetical protein [Deltaproteobacteria bacterium]MBI3293121.1 hypothetical protein [Deltaproteobacteria bacterium]
MSLFFSILMGLVQLVFADAPTIPAGGEDTVLTGGLSPKEFFGKRLEVPACQAGLVVVRQGYVSAKANLEAAVKGAQSPDKIDSLEEIVLEKRKILVERTFQCECAMRPVKRTETGDGAIWFETHGSCWVGGADAAERYARARAFLNGIKNYPQYRGGFSHVLEFMPVDPKSGALLKELEKPQTPTTDVFISIRGADFGGSVNSISYYFGMESKTTSSLEKDNWIPFRSKKAPAGFKRPQVFFLPASGRVPGQADVQKRKSMQWNLRNVMGSWYINSDGYIRYFTAADFGELFEGTFGLAEAFSAGNAEEVLSDTLFDMAEVARGAR